MGTQSKKITQRQTEIVGKFKDELQKHMLDLATGSAKDKYTIQDFAGLLFVHPVHLTHVIKAVTGRTPCSFYKEGLIEIAKQMLSNTSLPISAIAYTLTFDTSNFSKFFKRITGVTPLQYRISLIPARQKS